MEPNFRRCRRWRWDLALAACISAALGILLASELGHRELARGYERGVNALWAAARLQELSALLAEAETGQRGFLSTLREEDLEHSRKALPAILGLIDRLRPYYDDRPGTDAQRLFADFVAALHRRLEDIDRMFGLAERARIDPSLVAADRGSGGQDRNDTRVLLGELAAHEVSVVSETSSRWRQSLDISRLSIAGATALNVILLAALFSAMRRDWRRAQERQMLLNRLVRERTRQLGELASRLQEASEADKAAMARELHDEFGALLTAGKLDLAWVRRQLGSEQGRLAAKLTEVMDLMDQGLLAKQRIVEGLRPSALSHFGICAAVREVAGRTAERAGLQLMLELPAIDPDLPSDIEIAIFRIVQESLTNVVKHAKASGVAIRLRCEGVHCSLSICDDGTGFCADDIRPASQGLFGMRHRVEARKGHFLVHSSPGRGTRISVTMPLQPATTAQRDDPGRVSLGAVPA